VCFRGLSTGSKPAFRAFFARVGELRAHFTQAPMLCLTATASKTTQMKVKELLALKDANIFEQPPDRPNIRLYVNRVLPGPACLDWLVNHLQENPTECPKTIIYCRTFKDCSSVYAHFLYSLEEQPDELDSRLFDMIHSKTSEDVKRHVLDSLMDSNALPRIVIATKVIGMGLDVECQLVVHYGPPSTMDDYIQQIGRAGRDGEQAHAVMLYSGKQLRNVDSGILELVKNPENQCLRTLCLKDFNNSQAPAIEVKHACCGVCARFCGCGSCADSFNSYEVHVISQCEQEGEEEDDNEGFCRVVTDDDQAMLKVELTQLVDELNKEVLSSSSSYVEPCVVHGLSTTVLHKIMEQTQYIFSTDDLIDKCNVGNYSTVVKIVDIMSEIFGDMDDDINVDEDVVFMQT
jgi:superfamily II DNA helicase RecQ